MDKPNVYGINPDELDKKCEALAMLFLNNIGELAHKICEDTRIWHVTLAIDDDIYQVTRMLRDQLTKDLDTVDKVKLKLSDWL